MSQIFYRFRRADRLLEKNHELENQEIYFASGSELNDPMEGFLDIFWEGDFIVWENLFKHYLMCLEHVCRFLVIAGEDSPITKDSIPVFGCRSNLPTEKYKQTYDEICKTFFSYPEVSAYVRKISERSTPVRRMEMLFHLSALHMPAVCAVFSTLKAGGLINGVVPILPDIEYLKQAIDADMFGELEKILAENNGDENLIDFLFSSFKGVGAEIDLIRRYEKAIIPEEKNKAFVLYEFPEQYLIQLEKIVHPTWYTACFMSGCSNSSIWGHYGNNHSGVCMIFETEEDADGPFIVLEGINGRREKGPMQGPIHFTFQSIDYASAPAKIDFFRSLGRLSISVINEAWYSNEDGNLSQCTDDMFNEEEEWRNRYWESFYRSITVKSVDWEYEKEHRLILHSPLSDLADKDDRKLKYKFRSLKGIIFGIKTTVEDKLKIIEIIEKKCAEDNRADFKFYQAFYSREKNCIDHRELGFLKFPTAP